MPATNILVFDKENKQSEYQYMARDIETNKLVIGFIIIEQPWYSPESQWTYYIVQNEYGAGGMCGGATDLGFKKTIIDKNTIEVYNQIAEVKYNQEHDMNTKLVESFQINDEDEKEIAFIKVNDNIPYELWN